MLTAIGKPGEFVRSCDGSTHVTVGPPTPLNSPHGGGQRLIPDRECVMEHMLVGSTRNSNMSAALHESWQTSNAIRREDGHTLASFDPYFQVPFPSRYYDPAAANLAGPAHRHVLRDGSQRRPRAWRQPAPSRQVTARSPASRGMIPARHSTACAATSTSTATGSATRKVRRCGIPIRMVATVAQDPFPGSIRQVIATINTALDPHGPTIGNDRNYGGPG